MGTALHCPAWPPFTSPGRECGGFPHERVAVEVKGGKDGVVAGLEPACEIEDNAAVCREVRLSAGAGFVVVVAGDIMTMPDLPRELAAQQICLGQDGLIAGLS